MPPKPSEKRMQHFREMLAYDQAHLGFGTSLAGMDEVDRIASTPTGWQDAPVVAVTMTKVTVEE